jgi:hypothetical protein
VVLWKGMTDTTLRSPVPYLFVWHCMTLLFADEPKKRVPYPPWFLAEG